MRVYPKEIVEGEHVEVSFILHVQKFKDILQRCRLLPVFQRQHKVQIGLIVLREKKRNTVMYNKYPEP